MTIRPATADDIPFIMNLERACPTAAHWSEQQYDHLFDLGGNDPKNLVLVAEGESNTKAAEWPLLGFLVARFGAGEWELENIVVSPVVRRHGLGLRLLNGLLTYASETKGTSVFLEVRESNAAARALYCRTGFRETGRRRSYYSHPVEDAILYGQTLSSSPHDEPC